uniref:NADH dehydrogenase subunit 6 n=1 Tax=Leofa pulchella TaxID=1671235 RepID=UPI002435DBA3|nr:NADH dehydrogenase subunit 6 [Leofa pulchella]WEU77779.1 NADH dehydrogenase subunit 6 [Leofa pulchella]
MKMIFIKTSMYISTMILFMKTPMSMGILLLIQTIICTMLMSGIMNTSWMPMIMFLMFIGGLLILFMYMSSIASNEKFTPNYKLMGILLMMMILPFEEMMNELKMNESINSFLSKESISMMKIYNKKTMMITVLMFMYMFLAMIVVTSVISIHKGPLRAK